VKRLIGGSKKRRLKFLIIYMIFTILFSLSVIGFDGAVSSPIHEVGHAVAAVLLGVRVIRVEWSQIEIVRSNDWRDNVVYYSGGLFATFFLLFLYLILKKAKTVFLKKEMRVTLKQRLVAMTTMLQTITLSDLMLQLTTSILEGSIKDFYDDLTRNITIMFIIVMIFTSISMYIHLVRMDQSTIELFSIKKQTRAPTVSV
jgi:hypothetical protein